MPHCREAGDLEGAALSFSSASKTDPSSVSYAIEAAELFLELGDMEAVAKTFRIALSNPACGCPPLLLLRMARLYRERLELQKVRFYCEWCN